MRNGIDLPPLCATWIGNAHWTWHIGVKDRMYFLPPQQFFQCLERTNTAATTIQCAFRRKHHTHSGHIAMEETPRDQQALSPAIVTNLLSPTSFPIGCRVTVMPSHKSHTHTNGTLTQHTAKFVEFVPDNCHPNTICILPKSLTIIPPLATSIPPAPCPNKVPRQCIALHATDDDQMRTPRQRKKDNIAYDNLNETAKFTVTNGFVSFTCTFRYLGSSSIIVSATTTTSRQELRQPLLRWVH
jgi:hypothetical protein